jgi:hypothetical protein
MSSSSPRLEQQQQEYSEFEFQDSPQDEPLLARTSSDEESSIDSSSNEQKYKLPSEGGTIFSSFVKYSH